MTEHVVFRKSLPIGAIAMLQALATPVMAVLSLRLVAFLYEVEFDQNFVMLSVLVAIISLLLWTAIIFLGRWIGFTKGYDFAVPEDVQFEFPQ